MTRRFTTLRPAPASLTWRKSTRSGNGNTADCVELALSGDDFYVRDSKLGGDSPVFQMGEQDQVAFLRHLGSTS